jgi:hypothetical protein
MSKDGRGVLKNTFRLTVLILFIVSVVLMNFSPYGVAGIKEYGSNAEFLDTNLCYTPTFVYSMLDSIGLMGILAHIRVNFIDFLFIFTFLFIQNAVAKQILSRINSEKKYKRISVFAYLRAAFDITENILLITALLNYPHQMNIVLIIAAAMTVLKWDSLVIWIILLIIEIILSRRKK